MKLVRVVVLLAFASCVGSTRAQTRVVKNDTQINGLNPEQNLPAFQSL